MKRWPLAAGIILVGIALVWGGVAAQAQQDDALPPHVIDVWPLPGVELGADEPLTITFDQPMDRPSVEQGIEIDPALVGSFRWEDDRTMSLLPEGGWPRARTFRVTVGTSASAANGLTLQDAYAFDAQTIGALVVTAVTPEDGAEGVAADARIVVTFNRPVVPLVSTTQLADLPSPLQIDPPLAGIGEWLNTSIFAFTPEEALRGGTVYHLTVAGGLTTVTGAVLEAPYTWTFRTLAPQILSVAPSPGQSGVLLDSAVSVSFSQPMDPASTQAAFHLMYGGEPVSGQFSWSNNGTQLSFQPAERLRIASTYLVNLTSAARSAGGDAALSEGTSFAFETVPLPGVAQTRPSNGERDVRPGQGATISFRSPMNSATFEGKIVIAPEPETWSPVVWGDQSLNLDFAALPNTTYTITLLAGAQDVYGNAIETDTIFTYSTGSIRNYAYPIGANYGLAITGAHRENTRFSIYVSGTPSVGFELYRLADERLWNVAQGGYYGDQLPTWIDRADLVRAWTTTFDSGGREGVPKEVLLASDQGGQLPSGLYWVIMRAPEQSIYQFPLEVATASVTVKRAPDEVLIWAADMASGQPVGGAAVTVFHQGQPILRGQTDPDGVFRGPLDFGPRNDDYLSVVVDGPQTYGLWQSYSGATLPDSLGYLYTDRPIYRPGETVYFRGVLRDRHDMDYSVPNQRTIPLRIEALYTGQRLLEQDVALTDFGTFSGELQLAEDAPLGEVSITAGDAWVQFTIAEFRVPEFEVTVTPQQTEIFAGETLDAVAQASYYFGGAVSGASLNWSAYAQPSSFNYTGPGRYSFYDETQDYGGYTLGNGSATTDSNGRFLISTDNTRSSARRPMSVSVEASVTDESMQQISGRASVLIHPANVYVGMRTDRYFGREGQAMDISLIAVDAGSVPLADKRITLSVIEIRWTRVPVEGQFGRYTWQQEEIPAAEGDVRTGADGTVTYSFTPPNAGIFRVQATALDEYERPNGSSLRFWVTGSRPVWWGEPSQTIDLIADKDSYQPGDVAQVLVPIPFAGASTVLISTERAGIMSYEVRRLEGSTLLYELPITDAHVPTVYLDVTVVKGIDEESLNPDYRTGRIALDVEPIEPVLNVTVTPSAHLAQPRETVSFDVQATDAHGEPVRAEVGLALTDKAILALMPPNSGALVDAFYGAQPDFVYTDISLTALLDRITDEAVGVDDGARCCRGVGRHDGGRRDHGSDGRAHADHDRGHGWRAGRAAGDCP